MVISNVSLQSCGDKKCVRNEHVAKTRAISQSRKMLAQQQNVVWIFPPHAGAKLAAGAISKINQAEEGY